MSVNYTLAERAFAGYVIALRNRGQNPGPRLGSAKGLRWFRSMDRNGDGDVTKKEFLGTAEQFKKIDADKDGLIDPAEAAAVQKRK